MPKWGWSSDAGVGVIPGILCAGAAHWDIIARAGAALPTGADVPGAVLRRAGGVAFNISAGLAAAGVPVSLATALGDDDDGDALSARASAAGIDMSIAVRAAHVATGRYVAIEGPDGELVGAVADLDGLEAAADCVAKQVDQALQGGRFNTVVADANLTRRALRSIAGSAREAGADFVVNPVSTSKAERLNDLISRGHVTMVSANVAEAAAITGSAHLDSAVAAQALVSAGAASALVTNGSKPIALAWKTDVAVAEVGTMADRSVTGAGDALLAGYLAAAAQGIERVDALQAGLEAARRRMEVGTR